MLTVVSALWSLPVIGVKSRELIAALDRFSRSHGYRQPFAAQGHAALENAWAWGQAAENASTLLLKAIDRTGSLPRDVDGRVPSPIIVVVRPTD